MITLQTAIQLVGKSAMISVNNQSVIQPVIVLAVAVEAVGYGNGLKPESFLHFRTYDGEQKKADLDGIEIH